MGHPEKDQEFEPKEAPSPAPSSPQKPELDAVVPDLPDAAPNDIFREMDDYQKQIEKEWDSAKKSYQEKIDQIMADFVQEKGQATGQDIPAEPQPASTDSRDEKPGKPSSEPLKGSPARKKGPDPEVENMVANVHKTLQKIGQKSRQLSYPGFGKSPVINVPWKPPRPWYVKLLIVLACVCIPSGIGYTVWHALTRVGTVTDLPYLRTSGVLIRENKVYVVDWFRKAIYTHGKRKSLPILEVDNLPNQFTAGFTITGENILSVNGFNQNILKHALTPGHRVIDQTPAPGNEPAGLFYDGTDVWTIDNEKGTLYQLRENDLADIKNSYGQIGAHATAFQIRRKRVWILDGKSREVHVYRLQDPLKGLASFDLDPFLKGSSPTGLHVEKNQVWIATENPARMLRISRSRLEKANPENF